MATLFEKCDAAQENAVYAKRYVEHFPEMVQKGQRNRDTAKKILTGESSI